MSQLDKDDYIEELKKQLIIAQKEIKRIESKESKIKKTFYSNTLLGKSLRAPSTIYKILFRKGVLQETIKKYKKKSSQNVRDKIEPIEKAEDILMTDNPAAKPIPIVKNPDNNKKRVNLVTDTIEKTSLFGGVATALIIATELAKKLDCELRIITRNSIANPQNYMEIMKINGIEPAEKRSFYSDFGYPTLQKQKLEIGKKEIFIATSWWSAQAISETVTDDFYYIIQEVETFFYNYCDERLACEHIMHSDRIRFIINSKYLYEYFQENEPNITNRGIYFNPAFSRKVFSEKKNEPTKKRKKTLFFYARPNHPRNLYRYGIHIINEALKRGIIDQRKWDIYLVGQGSKKIDFNNGTIAKNLDGLKWTEYAEFLSRVDVGISLMYTPHPSYPPFDIACSGGVVLSNKMANKEKFTESSNVILADLDDESMLEGLKKTLEIALNDKQRKMNYSQNKIQRDWGKALAKTIEYMVTYANK